MLLIPAKTGNISIVVLDPMPKSIANASLGLGPVSEEVKYAVPPPVVYKDDLYKAHST